MLVFKFHQNRRQNIFWHRMVSPLDFSAFYLKSSFLPIKPLELPWQMVLLINSEYPNIYLPKKINRPHGIFCFIKKSYSTLWLCIPQIHFTMNYRKLNIPCSRKLNTGVLSKLAFLTNTWPSYQEWRSISADTVLDVVFEILQR